MKRPGRIQARLALAILLTALIPVAVAVWLGERYVRETGARYFVPEIGAHLDRSLSLYDEAAHTLKARMRAEGAAIALEPKLRRAVSAGDAEAVTAELKAQLVLHPSLVSLRAVLPDGKALASVDRGRPLDPEREVHTLSVGERQRIEIVRCLLQNPKLLIMDEPTSVLTPQEVERLFETLRQLASEGVSILYISHKLEEIRAL